MASFWCWVVLDKLTKHDGGHLCQVIASTRVIAYLHAIRDCPGLNRPRRIGHQGLLGMRIVRWSAF